MTKVLSATQKTNRFTISDVVQGNTVEIGSGFKAKSFRLSEVGGIMDPLIMVDHFTMSESTFGPHGHAGISAVSILLEDSTGSFHNQDSIGNDIDLLPGDLFWLKAGRGAVHDEKPRAGSIIHGLQIFVNLPAMEKYDAPESLLVRSSNIPIIEDEGIRVRVLLGRSGDVAGASSPTLPLTILDGKLSPQKSFDHRAKAGSHIWVQIVRGSASVNVNGFATSLNKGQAVAIATQEDAANLEISAEDGAQFVLIEGRPTAETIVHRGPFAMNSLEEVEAVEAAYKRGEFGTIS